LTDHHARNRNPEQTLERLTEAALVLFGQYGYERTTIDHIVSHAGLSKGAFYNHFSSKEEMFIYLLEQRLKSNQQRIQSLYGQETHPGKWLRSLLQGLLAVADRDKQWAMLSIEFMLRGMRDERLGSRLALLHEDWRHLIADKLRATEAYQSGRITSDPDTIAAAVMAMIDGLIIHSALEPQLMLQMRIEQLVEQLVGTGEEE